MTSNRKSTRYYSSKQETKAANTLGIRKQCNSGATAFQKGDLKGDDILVECKTVTKEQKSVTIQKEWFTKLKQEQISMRKDMSALVFDFGDGNNYVAVDIKTFKNLLDVYRSQE